ncbi:MAG: RluA family pseudouridine synthase [Drouetiella hepatica Uher 2000/2452]|jgi:tRNA pseudouridine32 synthase/23S rRNA pseudouridine746 synthase|uniref:RNA pseudouridylate synthase n=1 Tax=Drouetiella hepatica Uher 2000/2452 TaxID=904376 RepID=A0A951QC86_9CYAN|nr:RluA family pseudouridine synthase [Drouetiella hepatica Uher 2000/2452]
MLYPVSLFSDFALSNADPEEIPAYWYEGICPRSGDRLKLPRTGSAEAIARQLMQHLACDDRYEAEGKMYGVLLVELPSGERQVLKAFSGLLNGAGIVEGWVPPLPGREQVALEEAIALNRLASMKQEIMALHNIPERQQYEALSQEFADRLQELASHHQLQKQRRLEQRHHACATLTGVALTEALEHLDNQSRWQGMERRRLKQARDEAVRSLQEMITQADTQISLLKQQRKTLSRQLQEQLYTAYRLTNFAGESASLRQLMASLHTLMPTGTGDCCAPKLLHHAATLGLKPLAMAEFWWGAPSPNGDKISGEFYGACAERCQPLMGFLLSGLPTPTSCSSLPLLYQDDFLMAINKPAGLLSVPGRYGDRQDSVLNRLRCQMPDGKIFALHRLDQDTSGILLLARDLATCRQLSQQFQQRQIHKVYEAILLGRLEPDQGTIDLPLWADPADRPYQKVDERGKPSQTHFRVIARSQSLTRVEFVPVTGRSHQLRVHAADPRGLGMPILGDRLYGGSENGGLETGGLETGDLGSVEKGLKGDRLYLHAKELRLQHPRTRERLCLQAETPFAGFRNI